MALSAIDHFYWLQSKVFQKSKVKGGVHNKRGCQVKFASQTWVPKIFSNKEEKKEA